MKDIIKTDEYIGIWRNSNVKHKQTMSTNWIYQRDDDDRAAKNWINQNNVNILQWPLQSPNLNPIGHLWQRLKSSIKAEKFQNTTDLFETRRH